MPLVYCIKKMKNPAVVDRWSKTFCFPSSHSLCAFLPSVRTILFCLFSMNLIYRENTNSGQKLFPPPSAESNQSRPVRTQLVNHEREERRDGKRRKEKDLIVTILLLPSLSLDSICLFHSVGAPSQPRPSLRMASKDRMHKHVYIDIQSKRERE